MSDQIPAGGGGTRTKQGSSDDRKMSTGGATATGAAAGLAIGFADWLLIQCMVSGHWHFVAPSWDLIAVGAPIILLPVGLWFGRVFSLIGDIIINKLKKDDSQ